MYLAGMTRPDLSNAVRELGRRASSPCMRHWRALQHVARYLAGTLSISIMYSADISNLEGSLVGYSDSDWTTDPESRRSVTGYILLFNNSPVAWKSKSQTMQRLVLRAMQEQEERLARVCSDFELCWL